MCPAENYLLGFPLMPVALSRLKEVVLELRGSPLPERPRLPAAAISRGRVSGSAAFLVGGLLAFLWANTTHAPSYFLLRDMPMLLSAGGARLLFNLRSIVNEGLMTLFFFSIGLAARRQFSALTNGDTEGARVPCLAAAGALAVPALIMLFIPGVPALRAALALGGLDLGLAIAVFAVGGAAPASGRHPLFIFSVALDAGWVLALAIAGAHGVSLSAMLVCAVLFAAAWAARWVGARGAAWGILSGAVLWLAWRRTGLPPALCGALLAALVPGACAADERQATKLAEDAIDDYDLAMDDADADRCSALAQRLGDIAVSAEAPIDRWQSGVLTWLTWLVLPLFGWVNGGVALAGLALRGPAAWVALAFLVGRPLGIYLLGWVARRRALGQGSDSPGGLAVLSAVSGAGGVPAVMGALVLFSSGPAADPYIFWLTALSLVCALAGGIVISTLGDNVF